MVYVIDINGNPLMPTERHGKVRRLLREGHAAVVRRAPFTIRLLYEVSGFIQDVTIGVDAGSKTVGLSASTETKELYCSEVTLRNDIVNLISTRRESRRTRRSRKLRYRAARFNNRVSSRKEGWLAPSVRQKTDSHLRIIDMVCSVLPVRNIIVEVAQFDTQLLKNPEIGSEQYQRGEQLGFWNTREYVLFRDNHQCQHCHGKSKDNILNVHHLESRKTGGDSPDNLITLCETCHKAYHRGEIQLKAKRGFKSLRDAAFMSIMRWAVYNRLKLNYPGKNVHITYGYITKHRRIENGIEKSHCSDAFCIAGNLQAKRSDNITIGRCVPRHGRSMHVFVPTTGGKRRSAIAPHWIGKSRLQRFDTVRYEKRECIISGSTHGRPVLKNVDWTKAISSPSVNQKTVQFLSRKHGSIIYQMFNNQHV